ncbi:TNF-alpha-receptor-like protein [Monkeypox virus]|uniref:TNF-alpha-receptor-like protein n=1 Tax=Monkeypox virus TaxID=10244 RepID=Q3I7C5_MONPV|nr:TNF-alpha-receptor-like protein [Monkeypox virus]AAY97789.1 TNF-alpha-receptor-like protein [Monkeypox virus]
MKYEQGVSYYNAQELKCCKLSSQEHIQIIDVINTAIPSVDIVQVTHSRQYIIVLLGVIVVEVTPCTPTTNRICHCDSNSYRLLKASDGNCVTCAPKTKYGRVYGKKGENDMEYHL